MSRRHRRNGKTSVVAICSLAFMLMWLLCIIVAALSSSYKLFHPAFRCSFWLAIAAILSGIGALIVIKVSRENVCGHYLAKIAIVPTLLYMIMGLNTLARFKADCVYQDEYHMRLLRTSIKDYAAVNEGYLPNSENWADLLLEFDNTLRKDYFDEPRTVEARFAFNSNLSGLKLDELPEDVVLFFTAYGDWNLSGTVELFEKRSKELDQFKGEEFIRQVEMKPVLLKVMLLSGEIKDYMDIEKSKLFLRWRP